MDLLHSHVEALIMAWNQKATEALDRTASMQPLTNLSFSFSVVHGETEMIKRCLKYRWRKTEHVLELLLRPILW